MNIRIVSPAGQINAKVVERGVKTLKSWGHTVSIANNALNEYGRFAGEPDERAQDLLDALADPMVDIIWCTRGGYGAMQIADRIPLDLIQRANKPIIGYSDITVLHALWNKAGVHSLHAPMMKHLGDDPTHRTTKCLRELLDYYASHSKTWPQRHNALFLQNPDPYQSPDALAKAESIKQQPLPFVGGNLSVLTGLHGTIFDYDYTGHILFIEDIAEPAYKVDRMLQQLRLCGILGQVEALVVGHFTDCDKDPSMPIRLWDTLRLLCAPYQLPLFLGVNIGHELDNYPVIL